VKDQQNDLSQEASPDGKDAADDVTLPQDATLDVDADVDAGDASGPWAPYGLLSLNLHCLKVSGTAFTTNQQRFEAIAQAVATENIAAIAAQEVCVSQTEDALSMLKEAVESATGHVWSATFAYAHMAWEGTADEAEEGVGLLVRGPLSEVETLDYGAQEGLRRVAVSARLPATLGSLRLVSLHLDHKSAAAREAQARETASASLALADPSLDVLVAGDFNAQPSTPALAAMEAFGFVLLSAPVSAGRIDHVFAHRASAVLATDAVVLFTGTNYPIVSDHPGILVRLAPASGLDVPITRLRASVSLSSGDYLSVRGNTLPLSWTQGWPAWREPSGTWKLVLTEIPEGAPFDYKFLRNDVDWQTGDDQVAAGGADHVVTPSF
jgi:endonuclease/exonuclease/phosphatase family metal-dependent hydrolase